MSSDGVYLWYYGGGSQPDMYYAADSRDDAIKQGWGTYPEGDFSIVEADKAVPSFEVLPADYVIERYEECNEECWGEDGAEINATPAQERELEAALGAALQAWMDKHNLRGRVWNFGHMRNEEHFPEREHQEGCASGDFGPCTCPAISSNRSNCK